MWPKCKGYVRDMASKNTWPLYLLLASCSTVSDETPVVFSVEPGCLLINEVVAKKTGSLNEYGMDSDWFELYNPGPGDILLNAGEWFVSDAGAEDPERFALPAAHIAGGERLVVWCDKQDREDTEIHTNFALSASGEHLMLYHKSEGRNVVVDELHFGEGEAVGPVAARHPDGSDHWVVPTTPTPGMPNSAALAAQRE